MNGIINLFVGCYCGWVIFQYFEGKVSPNIFGFQVGETIFLAFFGLVGLYSLYGAFQSFRAKMG